VSVVASLVQNSAGYFPQSNDDVDTVDVTTRYAQASIFVGKGDTLGVVGGDIEGGQHPV